jgi:DNA-binding SARP family transcriptional activator
LPDGVAAEALDTPPPVEPAVPVAAPRTVPAGSAAAPGAAVALAGSTPRLRIWILGRFSIESAGVLVPESAWRRHAAPVVLKLLLLADFRRLPREHISGHLWPDADAATARSQLASAVYVLRRALEPGLVRGTPSRYLCQEGVNLVLRLGAEDWVDYLAFECALAEAAVAADPLPLLEQAAALYGGDLMPEEQNSWCAAARAGLRLRWQSTLLSLAEAQAAHRQFDAAASTLTQSLTADPSLEEAARRLMGLLGRQGRRSEALRLYERLRLALQEDLDAEPEAETVALAEALRAGTMPRQRQTRPSEPAALESARQLIPALIGRAHELEQVRAALLAARDGRGQILVLTGTVGIGKSRIADEAATIATILGFTVFWGRAAESEQELPYAPIAEALHAYIHTRPPGALRRDLAGAEAVRSLVPEVVAIVPSLAELPPLEHPGAERLRLWMAVRTLLAAAAAHHPLLLILEDLQWADKESIGLLTFLVRRSRDLRLLLLATLQSDDLQEGNPLFLLMSEGRHEGTLTVVPIAGLSPEEGGEMALRQLGGVLSPAQATALQDQCGGNPLFIHELLALLREPTRRRGDDNLLGAVVAGTAVLPATILRTLHRRLERRSPDCRTLLRSGAAIGERFPLDLLARVAGLEPDAFDRALGEAVERGLLREDPTGGQGGYILAPSLLRRVLYEELSPMQRQHLHAQIGAGLAEGASPDSAPNVAAIAHHYALSGDQLAAAGWMERVGDRAAAVYAMAAARSHYGKALDLLAHKAAPSTDAGAEQALLARLSEKLSDLLLLEGEYGAAQALG